MRYFLVVFMIYLTACAQEKNKTMKTTQDIYSLNKDIKKYPQEPMYKLILTSSECSFYLLVNDIPLYKFFGSSGGVGATSLPMNWNIAKSGKQKITVRMYPKYSSASKEMEKTLGLNAGVKFSIERELKGEDETVFEFKTPFKDFDGKGGGGFPYPNKPYYEETVFVNLEVPYQISVLDNAEKLYTDDTDKLKQLQQEVLSKYNQIRNIYLKGTKDDLANVNYGKEKRIAQQMYYTPQELKSGWDNDYQFRTDSNLEFFDLKPIENFKMTFYADGKLVCLEKINNKKSALWGGFKRKDKDIGTTTYIIMYLYRPKGSKTLEIY
ncbi:hypothetical protein J2810_001813 [Chryseobacterium rhizosphaerae]|uniref:hypothetical protein n=1 Tax=Chryseobacterium rhizosphaerae TaxID=395937 RepID=UPI0028630DEA|nr:hypothetical protein [Chryseobacterium rhizosphaerae]MDR6545765.1 hypothetical protein [Chryseobacterium rhizosphaerae]